MLCVRTGEATCPEWAETGRVGWVMRSGSEPLVSELWHTDLRLAYRAIDVMMLASASTPSRTSRQQSSSSGNAVPSLVRRIDSPVAVAAKYRASAEAKAVLGVAVILALLFNLAFVRRQRCDVEVKMPCPGVHCPRFMLATCRRSCCGRFGRDEASRQAPLILVHAHPTAIDEEGAELEVLVAEPASAAASDGVSARHTQGVVIVGASGQ